MQTRRLAQNVEAQAQRPDRLRALRSVAGLVPADPAVPRSSNRGRPGHEHYCQRRFLLRALLSLYSVSQIYSLPYCLLSLKNKLLVV